MEVYNLPLYSPSGTGIAVYAHSMSKWVESVRCSLLGEHSFVSCPGVGQCSYSMHTYSGVEQANEVLFYIFTPTFSGIV